MPQEALIQELITLIKQLKEQNKELIDINGNLYVAVKNLRGDLAKKQ